VKNLAVRLKPPLVTGLLKMVRHVVLYCVKRSMFESAVVLPQVKKIVKCEIVSVSNVPE